MARPEKNSARTSTCAAGLVKVAEQPGQPPISSCLLRQRSPHHARSPSIGFAAALSGNMSVAALDPRLGLLVVTHAATLATDHRDIGFLWNGIGSARLREVVGDGQDRACLRGIEDAL